MFFLIIIYLKIIIVKILMQKIKKFIVYIIYYKRKIEENENIVQKNIKFNTSRYKWKTNNIFVDKDGANFTTQFFPSHKYILSVLLWHNDRKTGK